MKIGAQKPEPSSTRASSDIGSEPMASTARTQSQYTTIHEATTTIDGKAVMNLTINRHQAWSILELCKDIRNSIQKNVRRIFIMSDNVSSHSMDDGAWELHKDAIIGTHISVIWKLQNLISAHGYRSLNTRISDVHELLESYLDLKLKMNGESASSERQAAFGCSLQQWITWYSDREDDLKDVVKDLEEALMDDSIWKLKIE